MTTLFEKFSRFLFPKAPPEDPYRGQRVYRCRNCSGKGTVALEECDFCGGTGWKRECLRMECLEHGCSGYFTCYEPRLKEKQP